MSKAIIGLLKYEPGPGAYIECLCIPVEGEGGAREFLGTVETIASERNNRGLLEYVEKLQALLPEEAP